MRSCRRSSLLALAILFVAGCAIESYPEDPGHVEVKVALDKDGLSIVDKLEAIEQAAESDEHHEQQSLRFVFRPSEGGETVDGELKDTRVLRTEFDLEGELDPRTVVADNGLFDLSVPAVAGRIELETMEGTPLGGVDFDPDAPVTRQMELMNEADILSAPGKIVNNGDSRSKVDILFVPEGYSESQMDNFRRDVQRVVNGLSSHRGYSQYWGGFNIWRQDIRSRSNTIGSGGRPYDTAFETAAGVSGVDRCVFFTNARGRQAANRLARNVGAEVTVVLVNSRSHGGCAGDGVIVLAQPRNVVDVLAHELGHALFDLADEYETSRPGGHCSTGPNVSSSPTRLPWADLVNTRELPTSPNASFGTIGAFEGAGYCAQGRYRPTHNCLMRTLNTGFCPVCRREVQRTMARYDLRAEDPTDSSQPSDPGGGTSGGNNSGSTSTVSTPTGLYPDFTTVNEPEISLKWDDTPGADYYNFKVEVNRSGSWRTYAEEQVSSTRVRVPLNYVADYRWRVTACNSGGCQSSLWARFTYEDPNSGGTSGGGGSDEPADGPATSGVPARPSIVSPAAQTLVRADQTSLDWNTSSGATRYNVVVQVYDAANQRWVRGLEQNNILSSHLTIGQLVDGAHYAWSVNACNSSGCSAWTDPAVFQIRL